MPKCPITQLVYGEGPKEKQSREDHLQLVANGAWPYAVREALKRLGWHALLQKGTNAPQPFSDMPDQETSALMLCYAWWARAKEFGIENSHFEEYMLDHLFYVENQWTNPTLAEKRVKKWEKYAG